MKITKKFADDAQALLAVLQNAESASAVLSALGLKETARMSPFAVRVDGGAAELDNITVNKWASASNEVLVYDQLVALLKIANHGNLFPSLGSHALVTYDGTRITTPSNPLDSQVYRLQVDESKPCKLSWAVRPTINSGIINAITRPLKIAIGTFANAPLGMDFDFPSVTEFWNWMLGFTVYEPLTLVFSPTQTHTLAAPFTGDPWFGDPLGIVGVRKRPFNLRPYFRGRGKLIITSAASNGSLSASQPLTFAGIRLRGVSIEFRNPTTITRPVLTNPARGLDLERCEVLVNASVLVGQSLSGWNPLAGAMQPQDYAYSTRLHRCRVNAGAAGYIALTSPIDGPNWGTITSCTLGNIQLGGFSSFAYPTVDSPINYYRRGLNRLGWRVEGCKWRTTANLYRESLGSGNTPAAVQSLGFSITVINSKIWGNDLVLGSANAPLVPVWNFISSFVRANSLRINDMQIAAPMLRAVSSSLFVKRMALRYRTNQSSAGREVDRAALNLLGYIHLQDAQFGVHTPEAQSGFTESITGQRSVHPTIFVEGESRVHVPATLSYDNTLVQFGATSHTQVIST